MELEVSEPLMFLAHHPQAPGRFARAIRSRLGLSENTTEGSSNGGSPA
jgi:hypothetical protein